LSLNPEKPAYSVTNLPADFATETDDEVVIFNSCYDGFHNSGLHALLQASDTQHVYICGCITSASVLMTMHGAYARGYGVTMINDACADRTRQRHEAVQLLYEAQYFSSISSERLAAILKPVSPEAILPPHENSAVLVVDLQEAWVGPTSVTHEVFPELVPAVQRVFMTARTFGLPLIHIRAQYTCEGSPWVPFFKEMNPEKPAYEVTVEGASFALEQPGEIVMTKPTYDAFAQTELHSLLQRSRVNHVYVLGTVTSACVLMTMHGAFSRGYRVTMIEDACADRSRERQDAVLALYRDQYIQCITSSSFAKTQAMRNASMTVKGIS